MPGFAVERYEPASALLSNEPLSDFDHPWPAASIGLSGLWEWTRPGRPALFSHTRDDLIQGVNIERSRELCKVVSVFGMAGFQLHSHQTSTWQSFQIAEIARLSLELSSSTAAKTVLEESVAPFQDFVSLVTGQPSAITDVALSDLSARLQAHLLYNRVFAPPRRRIERSAFEILLPFTALSVEQWEAFVRSWLDFRVTHRAFCGAFFGSDYAKIPYVELRFISASRAVRLLAAHEANSTGALAGVGSPRPTSSEPLSDALRAFLMPYSPAMTNLIPDIETFVEQADVWTVELERPDRVGRINSVALHWYTETLRMALRLWMILRFQPEAASFLESSSEVQRLRTRSSAMS